MLEERPATLDSVFHALADRTRRSMLRSLAAGEHNIGELAAPHRMSFAAASKHVKVLERAGLVRRRVQGRAHLCRLEPTPLATAEVWLRFYERFWRESLDRLDDLLRAEDQETASRAKHGRGRR
ncbi:MAG TPA: metalloregulator ArsR/SmtB family transcription factor [Steroidobacteraceae bacterium]|jgi:DNA-binding transcriptional ArsR family regulator|nr:metalloregulator ArsR/SmtB family transcription factor [Steroidobacteraceae bacterium]